MLTFIIFVSGRENNKKQQQNNYGAKVIFRAIFSQPFIARGRFSDAYKKKKRKKKGGYSLFEE